MKMMHENKPIAAARNCALAAAVAFTTLAVYSVPAEAEWRPTEPVEIMVHSRPGSSPDMLARAIQQIWQEKELVPVSVTVNNQPAQAVGFAYLNRHQGDGHKLTISSTGTVSGYFTGASDISFRDLTPISLLMSEYISLGVAADSPIQTGEDFVERLRQDPGSVSIGSGGARGNPNHTGVALVAQAAGVDPTQLRMVIYSSGAEARNAAIGGHVDAVSASAGSFIGQVEAGLLRLIAVAAPERLSGPLADVPTWNEQGYDVEDSNWRWGGGPGGLTEDQIAYWEDVFAQTVETDEWKDWVQRNNAETTYLDFEGTQAFFERQEQVLGDLLKDLGLATR
jgi:putative tricarboxylic transport membrane protein